MTTPISCISSRTIGTVESVSPDQIKVLLDTDAPRSTALNTGIPTPFPRINSFVLLPNEVGAVVGIVVWLGVERSAYPKRQGLKDFGLLDLPFPLQKMGITPIGTLLIETLPPEDERWVLEQGVQSFPSIDDIVILPTPEQTKAIVTGYEEDGRVELGACPTAHNALVSVDPDKLFGRHLAVLGNTGSGKSCTLAALIRSSVESAQKDMKAEPAQKEAKKLPNARFIVLDPNGEYSKCFENLGCRLFQVSSSSGEGKGEKFVLPAWMWNSAEWAAIARASSQTQRPLLQQALRKLKSGDYVSSEQEKKNGEKSLTPHEVSEDAPIWFNPQDLPECLKEVGNEPVNKRIAQFAPGLFVRIESFLSDTRMREIINPEEPISLKEWLENFLGSDQEKNRPITVVDLSLAPHDILHFVIAVASRLILEALQRYKKKNNNNLPTVLVLEEAHTFASKRTSRGDEGDIPTPGDMCRSAFEKIAREGRKFGLGLVLSSQRPSELSQTVLSQCNTFLLHRITNDYDQDLVSRLVPNTIKGLLKELPSLPTRHCILLGVASKVPTLIEVKDLKETDRPASENPDFWGVWTRKSDSERSINWEEIAGDWAKKPSTTTEESTDEGKDNGKVPDE